MQCANCGKILNPIENRFIVCDCKNTEVIENENNTPYVSFISNDLIKVYYPETKIISVIKTNEIEKVLKNLYQRPIITASKIKKEYINKYSEHKEFLSTLKTWAIVSHDFHYNNSAIYKKIFDNKYYGTALEIIDSCKLIKNADINNAVLKLTNIYHLLKPGKSLIALKSLLFEMDENIAILFSEADFEPEDYYILLNRTNFPDPLIIKWISELSDDGYRGEQISFKILDLFNSLKELKDKQDFDFSYILNENLLPHVSLIIHTVESYLRTGKLLYRDKIFKLKKAYERFENDKKEFTEWHDGNIELRPVNFDEAASYAHLAPEGSQRIIPHKIYKNGIESGILFVGDYPFIAGCEDDEIKIEINKFLEGVYKL